MKDQNPQELFRLLRGALSVERIGAYRLQADDEEIDLFCRYLWNIALCESLYPILNIFEVALRKRLFGRFPDVYSGTAAKYREMLSSLL